MSFGESIFSWPPEASGKRRILGSDPTQKEHGLLVVDEVEKVADRALRKAT